MKVRIFSLVAVCLMIFGYGKSQAVAISAARDGAQELHLPPAEKGGGRPFMELLNERKSTRQYSERELEPHILSGLLWAANGINREEDGKRTAPSARDMREIDVYVITPQGAYLYIPEGHRAKLVKTGDFRKEAAGRSEFAAKAPVILVFVANAKKMEKMDAAAKDAYAHIDCGYVSQNVYLYCASEKLATVALGGVDKAGMAKALNLKEDKVILSQPVGYME
jgi:SagB-type dehydrogenase family enzyme